MRPYFEEIVEQFRAVPDLDQFAWQHDHCTLTDKSIVTGFKRKYQRQGRPIYYTGFRKEG